MDQRTTSGNENRRAPWLGVWALVIAVLVPASAAAEIVLMTDGSWLKVATFEIMGDGERVRLDLPEGGALVLPMLRISRILEDEIVDEPEVVEVPSPVFPLRFADGQAVPTVPFGELIYDTARRHRLNPALVAAVASAESAFATKAVSHKGAQGLMQLMPATAARFGLEGEQVFDPARNLDAGSRYLSWLVDRFDGDLPRVLAGYNAGEGTVDRYRGVPPYRETRNYIARIFDRLGLAPWDAGDASR